MLDRLNSIRCNGIVKSQPHLTGPDLHELRQTANWKKLFDLLGVEKDAKKSRDHDWWGKSPLNPQENTASFHINDKGWYCHSTGQGGGVIELLQALNPDMTCYDAGRWLLEQHVSTLVDETRSQVKEATRAEPVPEVAETDEEEEAAVAIHNPAIRQDLRPAMTDHPALSARGIPPEIQKELGIGFWQRRNERKNGRPDPLNGRLVFQVRGLVQNETGHMRPVVLTHMGRALTKAQQEKHGKWWMYPGFKKSYELYNIDLAALDDEAIGQAAETEHIIIVEGTFDVAKLSAAGIKNVVATFGSRLLPEQMPRIELLSDLTGVERYFIFYDRDQDGTPPHGQGVVEATELLTRRGYEVAEFDWRQRFPSKKRGEVPIPRGDHRSRRVHGRATAMAAEGRAHLSADEVECGP